MGAIRHILALMGQFYVYVADHPVTGEPCYVGKGKGKRAKQHNSAAMSGKHSNPHLANIIRKHGPLDFTIVRDGLSEAEAFETERALIAQFGRSNNGTGTLANKTDGGEGGAGIVMSASARAKLSAAHTGKILSEAHRQKLSRAFKGKKLSPERRAKMSETQRRRVLSPEALASISAAHKGKVISEEQRAKMSERQKARGANPEALAKMHASNIGRHPSQETRAKLSAAAKHKMQDPVFREKVRAGRLGKTHSKAAKAKISAARRRCINGDMADLFAYLEPQQ